MNAVERMIQQIENEIEAIANRNNRYEMERIPMLEERKSALHQKLIRDAANTRIPDELVY